MFSYENGLICMKEKHAGETKLGETHFYVNGLAQRLVLI